jgi:hypothetical protein
MMVILSYAKAENCLADSTFIRQGGGILGVRCVEGLILLAEKISNVCHRLTYALREAALLVLLRGRSRRLISGRRSLRRKAWLKG